MGRSSIHVLIIAGLALGCASCQQNSPPAPATAPAPGAAPAAPAPAGVPEDIIPNNE